MVLLWTTFFMTACPSFAWNLAWPPWCCRRDVENVTHWQDVVRHVLTTTPSHKIGISQCLVQGLLQDKEQSRKFRPTHHELVLMGSMSSEQRSTIMDVHDAVEKDQLVWTGLPIHPLYKVLALRLCVLCLKVRRRQQHHEKGIMLERNDASDTPTLRQQYNFLLPAQDFGLEEQEPWMPPPPTTLDATEICLWFQQAGNWGVMALLGVRHTTGSHQTGDLIHPTWWELLQAAEKRHKPTAALTVAARARAKHAHRGKQDQFFGAVQGPPEQQNAAARTCLLHFLSHATWINIHTFSGLSGEHTFALELRVQAGYGARWVADWSHPQYPKKVEFRGFLEPQMPDGHLNGWKRG